MNWDASIAIEYFLFRALYAVSANFSPLSAMAQSLNNAFRISYHKIVNRI